jgi:hypothetical protein
VKRLWLCLSPTEPAMDLDPGEDDDRLRALVSCAAPGETGWVIDVAGQTQGEVLDPHHPLAWRWAYFVAENDQGVRVPLEGPRSHEARLPDPAVPTLVLP